MSLYSQHLFPNKHDSLSHPGVNDFYAVYNKDAWLKAIYLKNLEWEAGGRVGVGPATRYFQQMSTAMAQACSGDIYIMSETPAELRRYDPTHATSLGRPGNIFWSHEAPTLARKRTGTRLIAVDVRTLKMWQITSTRTWTLGEELTDELGPGMGRMGPEWNATVPTVLTEPQLRARDMCQFSGLGSQPLGEDWFG